MASSEWWEFSDQPPAGKEVLYRLTKLTDKKRVSFELRKNDEPIVAEKEVKQRRVFRVFEYFLNSGGKTFSRDRICTALWPKMDDIDAEKNLRVDLGKLRVLLDDLPERRGRTQTDSGRLIITVPEKGLRFGGTNLTHAGPDPIDETTAAEDAHDDEIETERDGREGDHHYSYGLPAQGLVVGREGELAVALADWSAERPLLIWGPPGIGKSTLALALLRRPEVAQRFGPRRYWLRCDSLESAASIQNEAARAWFGLDASRDRNILSALVHRLREGPAACVIDNFDTPYRRDAEECENFLRILTGLDVWLVVTRYRHDRPGGVHWAKPIEPQRLPAEESRKLFCEITQNPQHRQDPRLDQLLQNLDGVPRAIELLAHHAVKAPDLGRLTARWKESGVPLLRRASGHKPDYSMAATYKCVIDTIDESARRLLRILACLPDGVREDHIPEIAAPIAEVSPLEAADSLVSEALAYREGGRFRLLNPTRDYVKRTQPASRDDTLKAREFYRDMAVRFCPPKDNRHYIYTPPIEAINLLIAEYLNVHWAVSEGLSAAPEFDVAAEGRPNSGGTGNLPSRCDNCTSESDSDLHLAPRCRCCRGRILGDFDIWLLATVRLADFQGQLDRGGPDLLLQALGIAVSYGQVLSRMAVQDKLRSLASVWQSDGEACFRSGDYEKAGRKYREALNIYRTLDGEPMNGQTKIDQANCLRRLGDIALKRNKLDSAWDQYESALAIYREGDFPLKHEYPLKQRLPIFIGDCLMDLLQIAHLADYNFHKTANFRENARNLYSEATNLHSELKYPQSDDELMFGEAYRGLARVEADATKRRAFLASACVAWRGKFDDRINDLREEFPGEV